MDRHELRMQRTYSRRERSPSRGRCSRERGRSPTRSPRRAAYRADLVTPVGVRAGGRGADLHVRSEPGRRPATSDPWDLAGGRRGMDGRRRDDDVEMDSASDDDGEEEIEEAPVARGSGDRKETDGEGSPIARGGGRRNDAKDEVFPTTRRKEERVPAGQYEYELKHNRSGRGERHTREPLGRERSCHAPTGAFRSPEPREKYERRRRMARGDWRGLGLPREGERSDGKEEGWDSTQKGREHKEGYRREDRRGSLHASGAEERKREDQQRQDRVERDRRGQEYSPERKERRRGEEGKWKEAWEGEHRGSPSPRSSRRPWQTGEGSSGARAAREGIERVLYGASAGSRGMRERRREGSHMERGVTGTWDTGRWGTQAPPRVEVPVRFTGNEGTGTNLKNYLMQIGNVKYRCDRGGMDPIDFFLSLPNTLGGEAETLYRMKMQEWLRRAEEDGDDPTALFLARLRKQFPGHTADRIREFQDFRRKKDESLLTYYGRLMNLAEDVVCTDTSMLISKFLAGLDDGLAGGLRMRVYE